MQYCLRVWPIWTASSEFGTYRLCEQRRFRRACASAQSRQNLRCSLIQAVRRGTFRQKASSLAPLNGWACAVKTCHDGMLEDTNSLDGAHIMNIAKLRLLTHIRWLCSWWRRNVYFSIKVKKRSMKKKKKKKQMKIKSIKDFWGKVPHKLLSP